MKKLFSVIILGLLIFSTTGCFKRDDLEDVDIYTTVYPIEYLTNVLYGYNSEVHSIYPDGVDPDEYKLTDKQITDYSNAAIFVYNGLTNEKEVARSFINKNRKLKIIDVSYGLKYSYGVEELWLSPNNYLMLATTIKTNLQDFMSNKYIKEEIENNFIKGLEDRLSEMDASLRSLADLCIENNKATIVASDTVFKFLEKYGFTVIDLSGEENLTTNNLKDIQTKFKNNTYSYILVRDDEEVSETVKSLEDNYKATIIKYNMITNLTDDQRTQNETYFSLMQQNYDYIKEVTIGK